MDFDNNIQSVITNEEIKAVNVCFPIIVLKTKKSKCDYCKAPLEYIKRETKEVPSDDSSSNDYVLNTDGVVIAKNCGCQR